MPHGLRSSIAVILAGLSAGCGTSGLYWVDEKLSQLSVGPSSTSGAVVSSTAMRQQPAPRTTPVEVARTTFPPAGALRDAQDGALVAPSRLSVMSMARTVDAEPAAPKPISRRDAPIPAATATAPPQSRRDDHLPALEPETFAKRNDGPALMPLPDSSEDKAAGPFTLVSGRRADRDQNDEEADEASPPSDTSAARSSKHPEQPERAAAERSAPPVDRIEPPTTAQPIPKASRPAAPPRTLKLSNIALCKKIDGFGKFTPAKAEVRPNGWVMVYAEVTGRAVKPTAAGLETHLRGKLRLMPKAGGPTLEWACPDIVKNTPTEQSDFFCFLKVQLPESLSEGDYRLEVAVDDVHGGAAASGETSVRVEPASASTK